MNGELTNWRIENWKKKIIYNLRFANSSIRQKLKKVVEFGWLKNYGLVFGLGFGLADKVALTTVATGKKNFFKIFRF